MRAILLQLLAFGIARAQNTTDTSSTSSSSSTSSDTSSSSSSSSLSSTSPPPTTCPAVSGTPGCVTIAAPPTPSCVQVATPTTCTMTWPQCIDCVASNKTMTWDCQCPECKGKPGCKTGPPLPRKTCVTAATPAVCTMTYTVCEACESVTKTSSYPCNCPETVTSTTTLTTTFTTCPARRTCTGQTVTTTWTATEGPTSCAAVQATCTCVVVLPPTGTGAATGPTPSGSGSGSGSGSSSGSRAAGYDSHVALAGSILGIGIGVAAFML